MDPLQLIEADPGVRQARDALGVTKRDAQSQARAERVTNDVQRLVRRSELREPVGNLKDVGYDFDKLWFSEESDKQRLSIKNKECHCTHSCFMSSSLVFDWRTWGAYLASTVVNFLSAA